MLSKFNCNTLGWKTVPFIFIFDLSIKAMVFFFPIMHFPVTPCALLL